jgi:hypothetical protein
MKIDELTVEVRDSSLERVGQILPKDLVGFKAVLRFNNVGSWEITLPVGHPVGEVLRQPGSGIVVTGPTGVLMSGPTISATNEKTSSNPNGDWIIQGADDSIVLAERLAYPDPATADVEAQAEAFDARVGVASTLMLGYVDDNIGPNAPVEREIPGLSIAVDPIVGSTVYPSARFDILGELLSGIASVDGLGFDIKQVDGTLEFSVFEPTDRSGQIRMDVSNNTLSKTQYAYGSHALSRAIVAGQGQGTDRQFIEVTSTDSLAAETLWGRRIETFIDQRNTADENELTQAGVEKLADGGATLTSVDVVPSSDLTMAYGKDWGLGDRVTVVIDDQEVSATVTTVSMSIDSDGVRVGATVGDASGVDYEALIAKKQTNVAQRVNALERKEAAAGGGTGGAASDVEITVKNNTGSTLLKGQAVYINGSTGANLTVALAQANAESSSSKTLGLLKQDLANGASGLVVTEGFLDNIDTSGRTAGEPMWLSPTTPGGIVFGLANKPVAPNHMVFLGYVLRVQQNNGGYYVKVQNGFENDELHDRLTFVGDSAPTNPKDFYYWFNTEDGSLSFRYNDGDSSQWVQISSGTIADAALTQRVTNVENRTTTLEGVRPVSMGGTGATSFTANSYLKGNGTSAIAAQAGIPATDITSGALAVERGGTGTITGSGLIPMIPSSVSVGGGTASVNSLGAVQFANCTSVNLNNVFNSSFRNYRIHINIRAGNATTPVQLRLRASGVDNSVSYQWYAAVISNTAITRIGASGVSAAEVAFTGASSQAYTTIDISNPQLAELTFGNVSRQYNNEVVVGGFWHNNALAYDGFTIYPSAGSIHGIIQVYGYR